MMGSDVGGRFGGPCTVAKPRLEVRNASISFGGLQALLDVSLSVMDGEIMGLIGPNGAGKTTLMDAMSGFVQLDRGAVLIAGGDQTNSRPHERARAGLSRFFQAPRLAPSMTVLESVMVGAYLDGTGGIVRGAWRGKDEKASETIVADRSRHALKRVGLPGSAEVAAVRSLSYGNQRLAELARCLVATPKVIMLDEPAAGLSGTERQHLSDVLVELANEDLSLLVVEHDMDFIMPLCDRITVISYGEVIACDFPSMIQAHPAVRKAYLGVEVAE